MGALRRIVSVAPGEGRLVAALGGLMLATAAGAALGAAAIEGLLFASFDLALLPLLYVALGATTFALTLVASGLLAGSDRARLYVSLPLVLAGVVAIERAAAATGISWVYALLWLGMNVVTTLQGIAAWGLAGATCDVRQAKRVFPLLNAAKIGGTVVGSLAVPALVRVVAVPDLILLWAAALLLAALVAYGLRGRVPRSDAIDSGGGLIVEMRRGLEIVRASSLLRLLAVALVLFSVLYFSLALPFSRGARASYPDAAELASFLGLFNGATTVVALLASLFVANRLYARVGVVNAIVALGAVYLAGFAAIGMSGAFVVLVAARAAQTVWLSGIADTAYQALFNPVPPERRDQIRAFMEGVPGQAGIALAGVVLLVGDAIDPAALALVGIVASAATMAILWRTRPAYGRALADALRAGRPQPFLTDDDPFGALRTDADALAVTLDGLRSPEVAVRRVSAEILRGLALPSTSAAVTAALDDPDEDVRASAVACLASLGDVADLARFADAAEPLTRVRVALATRSRSAADLAADGDVAVRRALAAALPEWRVRDAATIVDERAALAVLLHDHDPRVRQAALAALAARDDVPVASLEELVDDADPAVSKEALALLARRGGGNARQHLRQIVADAVRAAAPDIEWASRLGTPANDAAALVVDALRHRAGMPARRALRASFALAGRDDADLVLESLDSPDRERRASAVELIETRGGDTVRPLVRLWEPGPADSGPAPILRELARSDPDALVREGAALAISGGGVMQTLPTISVLERVLFLRKVGLFAGLPPADLKDISALAREEEHQDGAVLAREDEVGDRMFVIASGIVRVVTGAEARVVARRVAGDVVGELSIVADQPRVATLVCEGQVRVLVLSRREFESIVRDRPQVAQAVIRVLGARLAEALRAA